MSLSTETNEPAPASIAPLRRRTFRNFLIVWLLAAVCFPALLHLALSNYLQQFQGVRISVNGGDYVRPSLQEGLRELFNKRIDGSVHIETYLFVHSNEKRNLLFKFWKRRRIYLDGIELRGL